MSPSISYEPFVLLLGICLKSCDKVAKHQTGINLCVYTNYSATWVRLIQAVVIDDRTNCLGRPRNHSAKKLAVQVESRPLCMSRP